MGIPVALIVGLGNPGPKYEGTRHNAGADWVARLAESRAAVLREERKFPGLAAQVRVGEREVRLLVPTTYMNRSGQAVAAVAGFYRIPAAAILVVHDDLDLPPGVARLKQGGGHGGHNGLRDVIRALDNDSGFGRLRLGIGHPGDPERVVDYVLSRPSAADRQAIEGAGERALEVLPWVVEGDWQTAMLRLHSRE